MAERILGFLSVCADRRFWREQTGVFARKTGLKETDFWIDARAGGTGKLVEEEALAAPDHAYHSGARVMGWGMHGDKCGGYPGLPNEKLKEIHDDSLGVVQERYPEAEHYSLWSQGEPPNVITDIKKVSP